MFTKVLTFFWVTLLLSPATGFCQADTIQQKIFLVGDAGELHNGKQPVIDWLKENVDWNDTSNRVI